MGQLINPLSFRLNKNKFWIIRWSTFLKTSFKYILKDDFLIFSFLNFLFYRLKKLFKKKFFFLIIDFIILKKKNIYFFLIDYVFLNKFYKKYFKKISNKINYIKNTLKKKRNFFFFKKSFFFFLILKKFMKKKLFFNKFKSNIFINLKKIKIKRKKLLKKKFLLKKFLLKKKNLIISRNFYKKFFILFYLKNFNNNIIFLILIFLTIYRRKINFFFINDPFSLFKFIKSFMILNIKKFLKNNLNLYISPNIIIKLKNIENIFFIKENNNKNLKFYLYNYNYFSKNKIIMKNNFFIKNKFILKNKICYVSFNKRKHKKIIFHNNFNKNINDKFNLNLPKEKNKNFSFTLKKNYKIKKKTNFEKKFLLKFIKSFHIYKYKNFINKMKKNNKNLTLIKKENNKIKFLLFNFNLKIFSIFFKFLFKKYRYNTNKILKLLENRLVNFIRSKTFIKGFKIKIKGRFTQKSRSSISLKNIGKYSLSKIRNKIIYFEETISTVYGISSIKLFFLIDNHFFNKKNDLSKKLLKNF